MSGGGAADALDAPLDDLYRAPLAEFVARRDALAKTLRAAGDIESAARVKALRKPTAVAWAINRLHLDRRGLEEIQAASAALKAALQNPRSAEERRDAIEGRRQALDRASAAVVVLLEEVGSAVSPDLLRRIDGTLLAVASGVAAGSGAPAPGRLHEELEPPGFEALLDAPAPPPTPAAVKSAPKKDADPTKAADPTKVATAKTASPRGSAAAAKTPSPPASSASAKPPTRLPSSFPAKSAAASGNVRDLAREKAVRAAQAALDQAEGELERATDQVEAARMRVTDAEKALAATRSEVDAARRELAAVRARRDQARRELDLARGR